MEKKWWLTGSILILLSIVFGAMGAHALKEVCKLNPDQLYAYETGVKYQMYHGLAFLAIPFIYSKLKTSGRTTFWFLLVGVILFSSSIYGLTIGNVMRTDALRSVFGPVTPIGGMVLILGWIIMVIQIIKWRND